MSIFLPITLTNNTHSHDTTNGAFDVGGEKPDMSDADNSLGFKPKHCRPRRHCSSADKFRNTPVHGGYAEKFRNTPIHTGQTANDTQVGGSHYKETNPQPWVVMEGWDREGFKQFLRFSALKRLARWDKKHTPLQDVRKAIHELQKLEELLK